jgi:sialic acid synthase SpsE
LQINGRDIGGSPYIIAELSCNHGGSIDKARLLIDTAKAVGADAVKLQTYKPSDLTNDPALTKLYERALTPREWHAELFHYAQSIGITIFSSAFSVEAVGFLESLGAPAHKLASMEIERHDLFNAMVATGKPVLVSTGMTKDVDLCRFHGMANVALLHCVSHYPTRIEDANLKAIPRMKLWHKVVGLSDHTPGYETAIAATALGASIIEKHLKLDDDCIDAAYSLDPAQFAAMCVAVRAIYKGMGDGLTKPTCEPRKR